MNPVQSHLYAHPTNVQLTATSCSVNNRSCRSNLKVDDNGMKSKVEFTDEELNQIAELVSENFEVYGFDSDSQTDKILQSIFRKIKGSEWTKAS